jgi:hypothetical protein
MDPQGCGCDDFDGPHTLAAPARNHYVYGMLLDEHRLRMEQRYFNAKRWSLNRLTVGPGVLCGLGLQAIDGKLVLAPGALLDGLGREVLVPVATPFDPRQLTDAKGRPAGAAAAGPVTVSLAYHACAGDPVPLLVPGCDPARCAPGTIRESFAILVRQGEPPSPVPWPPADFFQPAGGAARVSAADLMAAVVGHVTQASPDPPKVADVPVVLARVEIPADPNVAITDADLTYAGRSVLLSQAALLQMVLALWERVETGLAAAGGGP